MSRVTTNTVAIPAAGIGARTRVRLAVRVFLAFAVLLAVTITATSATLLYNSSIALRDEAEAAAVHLAEILSASFAEMGEISLANVARTLDATLDGQMVAQARIAAHLVAAAEAAGQRPTRIIETLDAVTATTVLDEFWITDEQAFAYLTNVRDGTGALVPFRFDPDPTVQPQASKFYVLLAVPPGGDDIITQPAQVREIDQQVYKYVGVGGVDKRRIVQVGNAIVFGEQEILTNVYATQRADVSAVIEGFSASTWRYRRRSWTTSLRPPRRPGGRRRRSTAGSSASSIPRPSARFVSWTRAGLQSTPLCRHPSPAAPPPA